MNRVEPLTLKDRLPAAPWRLPEHSVIESTALNQETHENRAAAPLPAGIRTVAVLLDGSLPAEHALPHALEIARRTGASLRLVRAYSRLDDIDPWSFSQAAARIKPSRREKQEYLANLALKIGQLGCRSAETVLIDSPSTVDALVSGVSGADLVVMSSRRRRIASQLWWLNTADQLRRRFSIPLLLTPGHSMSLDWDANPKFSQVLVPVDGSVLAQSIVEPAALLSRIFNGALTLLNVQDPQWSLGFFEHTSPRGHLLSTIQNLRVQRVAAEAEILTTSLGIGQTIAQYADSHSVDLIAIATHNDAGLSRWLRGSVADYLLRHSRIPILLRRVPQQLQRPEITTIG